MEKPLAAMAGLGWQGKHTNLVSREFGSWLFLGAIFTHPRASAGCAGGGPLRELPRLPRHLPDRGIPRAYRLDARRCISYLTIEHKGADPARAARRHRQAASMAATIASRCARGTSSRQAGHEAKLAARDALRAPRLADLARLDDAAFRTLFAKSPVKRTGRDRFRAQCADCHRQFRRRIACG